MVDIEQLELLYFSNDDSVPYNLSNSIDINGNVCKKEYKLMIRPIKVKEWSSFNNCLTVLTKELQDYNSPEIIQMSYLEFLCVILFEIDNESSYKLKVILEKSLGLKNVNVSMYKNKPCLTIHDDNENVLAIITPKEFNDIKKIILFQNIINYDDRYISPDIKKELEEYEKIKYANKDIVNPTLEKQKVFVISKTGISMKDINEMTYRTFTQVYDCNVNVDIYFAQKILQASQKYDMKEDAIHPLFKKEEDRLKSAFTSKGDFEGKMKNVT